MQIVYNYQRLAESFVHLYNLLGISVGIMDAQEVWRTSSTKSHGCEGFCATIRSIPELHARCIECDRQLLEKCKKSGKIEWQVCHAGLYNGLMPVKKNGVVVAYLSFGQMRSDDTAYSLETDNEALREELREVYESQPYFSKDKMESLSEIIPQILFSNNIQLLEDGDVIQQIAYYIEKNLQEDLSLATLCEIFHVSKNYLYKGFRDVYKTGINEYVIKSRVNTAKKLLRESKDSVYMIAHRVGINSCTYFSRIFKEHIGMSPNQYRKKTRHKE